MDLDRHEHLLHSYLHNYKSLVYQAQTKGVYPEHKAKAYASKWRSDIKTRYRDLEGALTKAEAFT